MTIQQEIKLITEFLKEDGLGENDEAFIKEKIKLLEKIIQNPERYKECDNLPTFARYEALKKIAIEINYNDTMAVAEWKIPIERKIEECQKQLEDVAPASLEEKVKKKKRDLYVGIIGRERANEIQKKGLSLDSEIDELKKAAQQINSGVVKIIEDWNLTEEQNDYIFVQQKLSSILNEQNPDISQEDFNRLKSIKAKLNADNSKIEDSKIKAEMKRLLGSSTINLVFKALERKNQSEEPIAKENEQDENQIK